MDNALINIEANINTNDTVSSIIKGIKEILTLQKDGNETLAILLHKEVSSNLAFFDDWKNEYDTFEKLFKEGAKKISTKKLATVFTHKKGAGAKYLIEYKKLKDTGKNSKNNIELLNLIENVINNVSKFKEKAKDTDYFKSIKSKPEKKIYTLIKQFSILKDFLEEVIQ